MTTAAEYSALITSQHRAKPKFRALVESVAGCFADANNVFQAIPPAFDLDLSVGAQLDAIGLWVGISRYVNTPFAVYFSFDTANLGFDQGSIKGPFDPSEGVTALDDGTYRMLIRAKIGANNWDGTLRSWQSVINQVFAGSGSMVFAVDNQDMSIDVYVAGSKPSAILTSLLKNGYLPIKPAGVHINGYTASSVPGAPMFGFDISNQYIAGFETGAFGISL
jgi:hypothetical protein